MAMTRPRKRKHTNTVNSESIGTHKHLIDSLRKVDDPDILVIHSEKTETRAHSRASGTPSIMGLSHTKDHLKLRHGKNSNYVFIHSLVNLYDGSDNYRKKHKEDVELYLNMLATHCETSVEHINNMLENNKLSAVETLAASAVFRETFAKFERGNKKSPPPLSISPDSFVSDNSGEVEEDKSSFSPVMVYQQVDFDEIVAEQERFIKSLNEEKPNPFFDFNPPSSPVGFLPLSPSSPPKLNRLPSWPEFFSQSVDSPNTNLQTSPSFESHSPTKSFY